MELRIVDDIPNGYTAYYDVKDQAQAHEFLNKIPGIFLIDEDSMCSDPNRMFLEFSIDVVKPKKPRLFGKKNHKWTREQDSYILYMKKYDVSYRVLTKHLNEEFKISLNQNTVQQRYKTLMNKGGN